MVSYEPVSDSMLHWELASAPVCPPAAAADFTLPYFSKSCCMRAYAAHAINNDVFFVVGLVFCVGLEILKIEYRLEIGSAFLKPRVRTHLEDNFRVNLWASK